jgi:hypothetical protein
MALKSKHFGLQAVPLSANKRVTLSVQFVDTRKTLSKTAWILSPTGGVLAQNLGPDSFDLGRSDDLIPGDEDLLLVARSLNPPLNNTFKDEAILQVTVLEDGTEVFSKDYVITEVQDSDNPIKFMLNVDFQ